MDYARMIRYCSTLPNARPERKWNNTLVFVVGKKMFAIFILDQRDKPVELWCKVDDDVVLSYTDQPGIRPAPYLGRAKWVAIEKQAMSDVMVKQVLSRARDIVFTKLSKRIQAELRADEK